MSEFAYDSEHLTEKAASRRCQRLQTEGYKTKVQKWRGKYRVYFAAWRSK